MEGGGWVAMLEVGLLDFGAEFLEESEAFVRGG